MGPWRIRLEGTPKSLSSLPEFLPSSCLVTAEDGETYLDSPLFVTSMQVEDLMAIGEQLLDAANLLAILHIPAWTAVRCNTASRLREDGSVLNVKLLSAKIAATATLTPSPTVIRADGSIDPPPQPARHHEEADLVAKNDSLRTALLHLREGSWVSLYKAYEVVRDAVGGERRLRQLNWISASLLTRFTRTAQSPKALGTEARHGVEVGMPPSNPLTDAEAKRIITDLIGSWLKFLLEADDVRQE